MFGGAHRLFDADAARKHLISLYEPGHGVTFTGLPAGDKLVLRYATLSVGTITVSVNGDNPSKLNVHSSGAPTGSYVDGVLDLEIPANAKVTVRLAPDDVGININEIIVGDDRALSSDIWNLPELPVASGPYSADWEKLSRAYSVPSWWRDAKFGAWSH